MTTYLKDEKCMKTEVNLVCVQWTLMGFNSLFWPVLNCLRERPACGFFIQIITNVTKVQHASYYNSNVTVCVFHLWCILRCQDATLIWLKQNMWCNTVVIQELNNEIRKNKRVFRLSVCFFLASQLLIEIFILSEVCTHLKFLLRCLQNDDVVTKTKTC